MHFPLIIGVFVFGLIQSSCTQKSDVPLTAREILNVDSLNKKIEFNSKGGIDYLADTINGKVFGNRYEFFENGNLRMYSFQTDSVNYTYSIEYDSLGNFLKVQGKPIVYTMVSADERPDSIYLKAYFSTFSCTEAKFFFSDGDSALKKINAVDDTRLSFIKTFEYWKNVKYENRFSFIVKMEGISNTGARFSYNHTIDRSRNRSSQ